MKKFKMMQHKGRQAGVTLMELIASLAVMATVVVGAVALYSSASSSATANSLIRDLTAIQSATRAIYAGQGTYGNSVLNNVLVAAKKLPTTIKADTTTNPNTLTHEGNGTITVTGTGATFNVKMTDIPKDICIQMLTSASGWNKVQVTGGTAQTAFPITPSTATTECALGTTITFTN